MSAVLAWWKYLFLKDKLDPWVVYFFALTDSLPDEDFFDVMKRFSLVDSHAKDLLSERIELRQGTGPVRKRTGGAAKPNSDMSPEVAHGRSAFRDG